MEKSEAKKGMVVVMVEVSGNPGVKSQMGGGMCRYSFINLQRGGLDSVRIGSLDVA